MMAKLEHASGDVVELNGWVKFLHPAAAIALVWSTLQIALVFWPQVDTITQRALHVSFAVSLTFAMLSQTKEALFWRWFWLTVACAALLPGFYIASQAEYLMSERIQGLDPVRATDYVLGLLLIILLFEAGRRQLGWGLTLFAAVFVAYFFLGPYLPGPFAHRFSGLERFLDMEFLSLQGLYGVPTGVSVSTVFYFILFAAIYDLFGGGRLIIDLALALTGRRVGGPAKAAIMASGMLGSVSGSAVANVMSTGIFTIPLMRRAGYGPHFAGGIEAAASTGAQLVPPVMGAAAFIMADFLQIPYQRIVLAAILPAVAYYIALLWMVDLEARRRHATTAPLQQGESMAAVLLARGHMLAPLVWLVWRIVTGFPVEVAAVEATGMTVLIGTLRASSRLSLREILEGLILAAQRAVTVALPCAVAGMVVAIISFTGLGTKFSGFMISVAQGQREILLILAMLASLVLGAGMPTTSAYIMAAILLAPSLASFGIEPLAAHFFIFYFAILSMVTPPVALAAYAAAAITKTSASATGWRAFLLSLPGFLIPFAAVLHPGLLMLGGASDMVWALTNVLIGFLSIGAGTIGWLFRRLSAAERLGLIGAGALMTLPGIYLTAASVAATALLCGWAYVTRNNAGGIEVREPK